MKLPCCLLTLVLLLAGCSTTETRIENITDVRHYHHVFVRTASNDSNQVDQVIVQELQRLGFDASSGPRTMMPDNAEVVIDYEGQWTWDFRIYLIQLDLTVRDARSEAKLAASHVFHPGITNKSTADLVRVVVDPLFGPQAKKK